MRRVIHHLLGSALLVWGLALAQPASLETTLDTLTQSLVQAEAQTANPVQALQTLKAAQATFEGQSADWPVVLRNGIRSGLQAAQTAVGRQSTTDLAAQLAVVRGLAGKQAYDAYFLALGNQQTDLATAQLQRLLTLSGLPRALAAQASLLANEASSLESLRLLLERGHLQAMRAYLEQATTQPQPQAFLSISRAYGLYLVIQERSGDLAASAFVTPLQQLTQNQTEAYTQSLTSLSQQIDTLLQQVTRQATTPQPDPLTTPQPNYLVSFTAGGLAILLLGLLVWNRRRQSRKPSEAPSPSPTRPPTQPDAPPADKPWNEEF
jgi:hypothetical protein